MDDEQLLKLHEEIWKHYPRTANNYGHSVETRPLTKKELKTVLDATKTRVVVPHNACMGFGIGIAIFAHPVYVDIKPEHLITITNKHISEQSRFNDGWEKFQPYFDTEQNRKWLAMYGFDPIKGKSYYDY